MQIMPRIAAHQNPRLHHGHPDMTKTHDKPLTPVELFRRGIEITQEIRGRIVETRAYYLGRSSREPVQPLSEMFKRMTDKRRSATLQPDTRPANRWIRGMCCKPRTDNTRRNKFSRNKGKTSTYPAAKVQRWPVPIRLIAQDLIGPHSETHAFGRLHTITD